MPCCRKTRRSVGINPGGSSRRSRHQRHQPKSEIPIAIARARGFLHERLPYASRHPKPFTLHPKPFTLVDDDKQGRPDDGLALPFGFRFG